MAFGIRIQNSLSMLILQDESAEIIVNYVIMDVVSFLCMDMWNFVFTFQMINLIFQTHDNFFLKIADLQNFQQWVDELLQWDEAEFEGIKSVTLLPNHVWLPAFGVSNT